MIKAKIILSALAVGRYEQTGNIPSEEWLSKNSGELKERVFSTVQELIAYDHGLSDMNGYDDFLILPEKSIDCRYCESWREYFSNKSGDVFCPDCGNRIMFEIYYDEIHFKNNTYKTREITIPDEGLRVIASEKLSDVLMVDDSYVSKEAQVIDETIYFFIPEKMMNNQDDQIIEYITQNI